MREWCSLAALLSLGHLLLCSLVSALRYLVTQTLTHSLTRSLTHMNVSRAERSPVMKFGFSSEVDRHTLSCTILKAISVTLP